MSQYRRKLFYIFLILIYNSKTVLSQDSASFFAPSPSFNSTRCIAVASTQAVMYGASLYSLNYTWYANYNRTPFQFFDDRVEWLQMDKAGHFMAINYLTKTGAELMRWSGVPTHKSILFGGMGGFLFLTGVEVLDAHSAGWGFSWADFTANTLGMGVGIFQTAIKYNHVNSGLLMGFANTSFKFSFHQTDFPALRSGLLGKTLKQQILKDYNGQTYWVSINVSSCIKRINKFPKWLNMAVGYGAEGMLGAREGIVITDFGDAHSQYRHRQYYFSLDVDLKRIKSKSYFIKALAHVFSFVKIPAPAIEFSKKGMKVHPFYF